MPQVSETEIEIKRRVPVTVIEWIIAPVRVDPEVRIIPPIISETESKSAIEVQSHGIRLIIIPVRIAEKRVVVIKSDIGSVESVYSGGKRIAIIIIIIIYYPGVTISVTPGITSLPIQC
jgi:hypothetical protein